MREIFVRRGKRVDNGEWVYGNIVFTRSERAFLLEGSFFSGERHEGDFKHGEIYGTEVIPETVGQYTGLTDKNGVRVFEGDICRFKRFNDVYVGEIVFNVITASFVMWYQSSVGAYGEKATHKMLLSECDDIEVIGNVHDSPEIKIL